MRMIYYSSDDTKTLASQSIMSSIVLDSSSGTYTAGSLTDGSDGGNAGSPASPRKKFGRKRRARTMPEIIFAPRARTLSELQEERDRVIYT